MTLSESVQLAKQRLPLPNLMGQLGEGQHAHQSANCPFHEDRDPSFSVFNNEGQWFWKCHSECGAGDEVDYLKKRLSLSNADAMRRLCNMAGVECESNSSHRTEPKRGHPKLPVLEPHEELHPKLAKQRGLSVEAINLAAEKRLLHFTLWYDTDLGKDRHVWLITDQTQQNAQIRSLYPQSEPTIRGKKVWTLPHSRASWPIGIKEAATFPKIALVEGGPDLLAACHFIHAESKVEEFAPVAMLGAANSIPDDALQLFKDKHVRIFPHADKAGIKAAIRWAGQLQSVAATVDCHRLADKLDGTDLNDQCQAIGPGQTSFSSMNPQVCTPEELKALLPADLVDDERNGATPNADNNNGEIRKERRDFHPSEPEPWPDPIDGASLLHEIRDTITRHLVLPQHAPEAVALWIFHTYGFNLWLYTPYLSLLSPEMGCGKTVALSLVGRLVNKPLSAANITPAATFRTIEKWQPTLLIDEVDTFLKDNDELRGVLNSGFYKPEAVVLRLVGEQHEPKPFSTWCPKAFAGIGQLPGTLEDRSINIAMRRRLPDESVLRLRQLGDVEHLRQKACRWVADHADDLESATPSVPNSLSDRAQDIWEPLLAIADVAGEEWPTLARQAAESLSARGGESRSVMLLEDIRDIIDRENYTRIPSTELCTKLNNLEDRPWPDYNRGRGITPTWLAKTLKPFSIVPTSIRSGETVLRGYHAITFRDTFKRYLGPTAPQ